MKMFSTALGQIDEIARFRMITLQFFHAADFYERFERDFLFDIVW